MEQTHCTYLWSNEFMKWSHIYWSPNLTIELNNVKWKLWGLKVKTGKIQFENDHENCKVRNRKSNHLVKGISTYRSTSNVWNYTRNIMRSLLSSLPRLIRADVSSSPSTYRQWCHWYMWYIWVVIRTNEDCKVLCPYLNSQPTSQTNVWRRFANAWWRDLLRLGEGKRI